MSVSGNQKAVEKCFIPVYSRGETSVLSSSTVGAAAVSRAIPAISKMAKELNSFMLCGGFCSLCKFEQKLGLAVSVINNKARAVEGQVFA